MDAKIVAIKVVDKRRVAIGNNYMGAGISPFYAGIAQFLLIVRRKAVFRVIRECVVIRRIAIHDIAFPW